MIPVPLDRRIQGDRVRTRIALIAIIAIITVLAIDDGHFRLGPTNDDKRDAYRRPIPQPASEIWMQTRARIGGKDSRTVDIHRCAGDILVPGIVRGKNCYIIYR
jgi:hypothetical protein